MEIQLWKMCTEQVDNSCTLLRFDRQKKPLLGLLCNIYAFFEPVNNLFAFSCEPDFRGSTVLFAFAFYMTESVGQFTKLVNVHEIGYKVKCNIHENIGMSGFFVFIPNVVKVTAILAIRTAHKGKLAGLYAHAHIAAFAIACNHIVTAIVAAGLATKPTPYSKLAIIPDVPALVDRYQLFLIHDLDFIPPLAREVNRQMLRDCEHIVKISGK